MAANINEHSIHSYFDKIAKKFFSGSVTIDCTVITLTQRSIDHPKIYTAPGSVTFDLQSGGNFRIVVSSPEATLPNNITAIMTAQVTPGVLVPEHHYYDLTATCVSGHTWESTNVEVNIEYHDGAFVIEASFNHMLLNSESARPDRYVNYFFSDKIELPLNQMKRVTHSSGERDDMVKNIQYKAEGVVQELNVSFEKLDEEHFPNVTRLSAKSDTPDKLTELHARRLLDTTRFCTASLISPTASIVRLSNTTTAKLTAHRKFNKGMVGAPSPNRKTEEFFKLFSCYFKHVCSVAPEKEATSIIGQLNTLYTLSGVNLETIALITSVTCEAITKNNALKKISTVPEETLLEITKILEAIKSCKAQTKIIERACSAIGGMKSIRAQDRFYALEKVGAITEDEIKSWRDLRNPAAHGSLEVGSEEFQEVLDKVFKVIQLIYKLTFFIIEYQGRYTDYGTRGWPVKTYDSLKYKELLNTPAATLTAPVPLQETSPTTQGETKVPS